MESENHIKVKEVSIPIQALRRVVLALTAPLFKRKFIGGSESGFSRSEELAGQGYGSLIGITHFSMGDTPAVVARIFASPELRKREFLLPIAFHQYRNWYGIAGRLLGIRIVPIVTLDTLKYAKISAQEAAEKHAKKFAGKDKEALTGKKAMDLLTRDRLNSYVNRTVDNLRNGGVTYVALQAGGRSELDEVTSALSILLNRANRAGVENIAVSFFALGLLEEGVEVKDYNNRGFNLDKVYTVTEGVTMTKEELEERAKDPITIARAKEKSLRQKGLKLRGISPIDYICYKELVKIAPQNYLPQEIAV